LRPFTPDLKSEDAILLLEAVSEKPSGSSSR